MSHRRHIAALTMAVLALLAPRAETAGIVAMSPVPDAETSAFLDGAAATLDASDQDASCVAACAATRDRLVAGAEKIRNEKGFYSSFDSNCWTPTGTNCVAPRNQCLAGCSKNDSACRAACNDTFQSCCFSGRVAVEQRDYSACVAKCPAGRPASSSGERPAAATSTPPPASAPERKRALAPLLTSLGAPDLSDASLAELSQAAYDALRRELAFAQVSIGLARHGAQHALVSGGGGRLWVVNADGSRHPLDPATAQLLRSPVTSTSDLGAWQRKVEAGLAACGVDRTDAIPFISAANTGLGTMAFPAGEVVYFRSPLFASVEHFSIKGTINGGGDFI